MERTPVSTVISPSVPVASSSPLLALVEPSVSLYRSSFLPVLASLVTLKLMLQRALLKPVLQAELQESALSKRKSHPSVHHL